MATARKPLIQESPVTKPNTRAKPKLVIADPLAIAEAEAAAAVVTSNAAFNSTLIDAKVVSDDMVVANVPKAFKLTLDDHTPVNYVQGTVKMPREHAEHYYAVAHGVTILE